MNNEIFAPDGSFSERLPEVSPLSIDEFKKLSQAKLGLRTTSPNVVEDEIRDGVEGDYLILSALGGFLTVEGEDPDVEDSLVESVFQEPDFARRIHGLDTLSRRYQDALHSFFLKRAIPALGIRSETRPTVSQILAYPRPSLLFINDKGPSGGYDRSSYFGFPKKGKNAISPHQIIGSTGLTEADYALLRRRYESSLDKPSEITLVASINNDVAALLVGKTFDAIREKISI